MCDKLTRHDIQVVLGGAHETITPSSSSAKDLGAMLDSELHVYVQGLIRYGMSPGLMPIYFNLRRISETRNLLDSLTDSNMIRVRLCDLNYHNRLPSSTRRREHITPVLQQPSLATH